MNFPIKHTVYWLLIRQKHQTQTNKENIHENRHRVEHDYKVRDKAMLTKQTS